MESNNKTQRLPDLSNSEKPERWQQVKAIFQSALSLIPSEREAFLENICAGDLELRREVESFLKAHEESAEDFIEQPAVARFNSLFERSSTDLTKGQKIGNYEIKGKIGEGGMGCVYLAIDTRLGRRVALKILPANFSLEVEQIRRFRQEAQAVSLLNHPNIVTIYEVGEAKGNEFIVTEFVEGETLRDRIRRERLSLAEILQIVSQVCDALVAAHQAGIIHRDIKPENIMLRPDGYVKILDFGLAKLTEKTQEIMPSQFEIGESRLAKTTPGTIMGTVAYMSPEQAEGLAVDERTDIWSLGVIIYEMATGNLPFEGATPSHFIVAILEKEPAPLNLQSPEFERIIRKALQKNRAGRYQTAGDFQTDINQLKKTVELSNELKSFSTINLSKRAKIPTTKLKQITVISVMVMLLLSLFGMVLWLKNNNKFLSNSSTNDSTNDSTNKIATNSNNQKPFKNSIGMEFVLIPAGTFTMGSPTDEKGSSDEERPQHRVTISKDFYLGKFEVTQAQWKAIMGNNPSFHRECGEDCPVERVSWNDVQEFIKKLREKNEGSYRLPTEAEWEYACRAGTSNPYNGENLDEIAWYIKNPGDRTYPVGQKKPNSFNLFDMHGNVWEWTADWFGNYPNIPVNDPRGVSSGVYKVYRGGSWGSSATDSRSAFRGYSIPTERESYVGFRLVME